MLVGMLAGENERRWARAGGGRKAQKKNRMSARKKQDRGEGEVR